MLKIFKQVGASLLVGLGGICLIAGIYAPFNPDITQEEKTAETLACLMFGVPLTGWGIFILRGLGQQNKQQTQAGIQSIFYRLLRENNGKITVMRLAMEAQISGKEAEKYLNEKAREFQATFDVGEDGEISYCFPI